MSKIRGEDTQIKVQSHNTASSAYYSGDGRSLSPAMEGHF